LPGVSFLEYIRSLPASRFKNAIEDRKEYERLHCTTPCGFFIGSRKFLIGLRFVLVLAKVRYTALWALWLAGHANIAAVQYQPMMCIKQKLFRYESFQFLFN